MKSRSNIKTAKARRFFPAFTHPWVTYSVKKAAELGCLMLDKSHSKDIAVIHKLLVHLIGDGIPLEDGMIVDVSVKTLRKRLVNKHVVPLQFVCHTLNLLWMQQFKIRGMWTETEVKTRGDLSNLLIDWVCKCLLYAVPCI